MKISFIPSKKEFEDITDPPPPSKNLIPEWYKELPGFKEKEIFFNSSNIIGNLSVKQCIPFIDSLTSGYMQTTWTDIYIEDRGDGVPIFRQKSPPLIVAQRPNNSIKTNDSYYPIEFVWKSSWIPQTPKGYSCLITHPLNRLDLPFTTISGIVDTDEYHHMYDGQFPFYLQKGFTGLIPMGTPMFQIIPFKRDDWQRTVERFDEKDAIKKEYLVKSVYFGLYKRLFWKRKNFS